MLTTDFATCPYCTRRYTCDQDDVDIRADPKGKNCEHAMLAHVHFDAQDPNDPKIDSPSVDYLWGTEAGPAVEPDRYCIDLVRILEENPNWLYRPENAEYDLVRFAGSRKHFSFRGTVLFTPDRRAFLDACLAAVQRLEAASSESEAVPSDGAHFVDRGEDN